jgi:RadC-like JAB domain
VYSAVLHLAAAAVVFVHNHLSGDPMPSQEAQEFTRRLKECGEILAIRVLDHVIYNSSLSSSNLGSKRLPFSFCVRLIFRSNDLDEEKTANLAAHAQCHHGGSARALRNSTF